MTSPPTMNVILKRFRTVRDSWVMLDEQTGFVPLPRERILFTSPPRTTLVLQSPNSYPGKEPLAIQSSAGTAFLTNQRVSKSLVVLSPRNWLIEAKSWSTYLRVQPLSSSPFQHPSLTSKIHMSPPLFSALMFGPVYSSLSLEEGFHHNTHSWS